MESWFYPGTTNASENLKEGITQTALVNNKTVNLHQIISQVKNYKKGE